MTIPIVDTSVFIRIGKPINILSNPSFYSTLNDFMTLCFSNISENTNISSLPSTKRI